MHDTTKELSAIEKLKLARARVMRENPFWGVQSLRLIPVEDSETKTLWTDGISVGFNPAYVLESSLRALKTDWARQVCHVILEHPFRRGLRSKEDWSKACNYAANSMLCQSGFALSPEALYSEEFQGLSAEAVYTEIYEEPENDSENQENSSNEGEGQDSPADCLTEGSYGEIRDCPLEEGTSAKQEARDSLQTALNGLESGIGELSGAMKEQFNVLLHGKMNWHEMLNNFIVSCSGSENYTWSKPNQNYLHLGLYLPALKASQTKGFVFYFDTSLSVKLPELEAAHCELSEILSKVNPERVTAIYGDTEIKKITEYFSGEIPQGLSPGRGGTRLEPLFEEIQKLDYEPACLVIFTDMEVRYPPDPMVPVLWLTTRSTYVTPPYGEVIKISAVV